MILESKTLETFGYEFKSLSKNSHKRVCIKCDYCGKEYDAVLKNRTLGYKKLPKDACNDCRYVKREEMGNNPFSRPEVKEKIRQKNIEKYGVEWHTQSESFKEKSKQTCLEKYGVEKYSQTDEAKQKYKETCLRKYGVENVSSVPEIRDKAKKTILEKYGSENFLTTKECKQGIIDKFGVDNVFKLKEFQDKAIQTKIENGSITTIKGKTYSEYAKITGFSVKYFKKMCKDNGLDYALNHTRVKTDIEWAIDRILTRNNIQFEEKVKVGKYIPDFICGKVIIEADGLYYHSEKFADRYYHFNKREEYIKLGYKPLFFTSDEIQH
jgi:very-short-patch-repair endonuclease